MTFEELKEHIDLEKFLEYCGYSIRRDKSSKRWPVYTNGNETVIVGNYGNIKLYQVHNADRGSVINFCFNRPELLEGYTGTIAQRVNQLLHDFMKLPVEHRMKATENTIITEDRPFKMPENCYYLKCKNKYGSKFNYLRNRGILNKTLHSSAFSNIGLFYDGNTGFTNIAFPIYNYQNKIQGYDRRGFKYKSFVQTSNKNECIWISNNNPRPEKIVIGESPIDMLSYHQLYGKNTYQYLSINGNMGHKQIVTILELICQRNPSSIISAFDNDIAGVSYTSKLVFSIMEEQKIWPVYVDQEHQKFVNLSNIEFLNQVTEYPDVEIFPEEISYTLVFKNDIKTLQRLNLLAAKCCKSREIKIEIPNKKDWNEDLTTKKKLPITINNRIKK